MSADSDTALIELIEIVKQRRVVHGYLRAEPAVAQVGPVADLAVANADQIREAVAGQVSQVDGFGAVGENEARPVLLVQRLWDTFGGAESRLSQRAVPSRTLPASEIRMSA